MTQSKPCLNLASDCSGMGTDYHAAKAQGLRFRMLFASDSNKHCRSVLMNHQPQPEMMFEKAGEATIKCTEEVDLYSAGFPCQPYSSAGKGKGVSDKSNLALKTWF